MKKNTLMMATMLGALALMSAFNNCVNAEATVSNGASTSVYITCPEDLPEITCNADFTMVTNQYNPLKAPAGSQIVMAPQELRAVASGDGPFSYEWRMSADGGLHYGDVLSTASSYTIPASAAVENSPIDMPYYYTVRVTDSNGKVNISTVKVLVDDYYNFRTESSGDVSVTGYMSSDLNLSSTIQSYSNYPKLLNMIDVNVGKKAILACTIGFTQSSYNMQEHFGKIQVQFNVGKVYQGKTLCVFKQTDDGKVETYEGVVDSEGILKIVVDTLGDFMVEDAGSTEASSEKEEDYAVVNIRCGENGSITPSGRIAISKGGKIVLTFNPNDGFVVDALYINGEKIKVSGNEYILENITKDSEIKVTFKERQALSLLTGDNSMVMIIALALIMLVSASMMIFLRKKKTGDNFNNKK